jgi:hypothetical protein
MNTTLGRVTVRRADERGRADFGWLDTRYTFSFGDYHDPAHMGFSDLRVINEDWVAPARGFPRHPHRDMEILTYVLEGAVEHADSEGNGGVVRAGDVQRMSAGTGILHSEKNPSPDEALHLLQIWILPESGGIAPSYEQQNFSADDKRGVLRLIASRDGRDGSVTIHQDVELRAALLEPGGTVEHALPDSRHAWVQVASGHATVNGVELGAGDCAAVSDATLVAIRAVEASEILLFDLR